MPPTSLEETVRLMASAVKATEAIAFRSTPAFGRPLIEPLVHVRPDDADSATRAKAVGAFAEMVEACVVAEADDVFEVAAAAPSLDAQFCLVSLARNGEAVVGATAFITRCPTMDHARRRLNHLREQEA
jgi:hypothetical protein